MKTKRLLTTRIPHGLPVMRFLKSIDRNADDFQMICYTQSVQEIVF